MPDLGGDEEEEEEVVEASPKPLGLIPPNYVQLYYQAEVLERKGRYAAARAKRREAAEVKRTAVEAYKKRKEQEAQIPQIRQAPTPTGYYPRARYQPLPRSVYESMTPYERY